MADENLNEEPVVEPVVPAEELKAIEPMPQPNNAPEGAVGSDGKLTNVSGLFSGAFSIYKKNWLKFLVVSVLISVISLVSEILIYGKLNGVPSEFDPTIVSDQKFWLGLVFALVLTIPLSLALSKLVYSTGEGEDGEIGEAVGYGFKNYFSYLWVSFMTGLFVIVGLVLLVLPGVYVAILLSLVGIVYILEGKRGLSVLKRSRELVRGYFWPVFGRILVVGIVTSVLAGIFNSNTIASDLATSIIAPFSAGYTYLIYKSLRSVKKI